MTRLCDYNAIVRAGGRIGSSDDERHSIVVKPMLIDGKAGHGKHVYRVCNTHFYEYDSYTKDEDTNTGMETQGRRVKILHVLNNENIKYKVRFREGVI